MSTVTDLESYQQFALQQQAQNNAWSAEQAQKQMDFQREMSNTAHQREVKDLQAAGLNPILSVNSGASVPNGASAEPDTSTAGNVGAILQQVLQAQSAREVAGMYNAATIAAATIAANASMYGSDMNYWNTEDHPNTAESVAARLAYRLANGSHGPGTGSSPHDNHSGSAASSVASSNGALGSLSKLFSHTYERPNPLTISGLDALINSKSVRAVYGGKSPLLNSSAKYAFLRWCNANHIKVGGSFQFFSAIARWAQTDEGKAYKYKGMLKV